MNELIKGENRKYILNIRIEVKDVAETRCSPTAGKFRKDHIIVYLRPDSAGASSDPGRPVCRQPPSAAGAPQPLLPLPHPGTHTCTHTCTHSCLCVWAGESGGLQAHRWGRWVNQEGNHQRPWRYTWIYRYLIWKWNTSIRPPDPSDMWQRQTFDWQCFDSLSEHLNLCMY